VGIKAIKEAGGIILVQDPDEAEYGSMPRSAVATGRADFVLPLRELAARLPELIRDRKSLPSDGLAETDGEAMQPILSHLRVRSGHDFSSYKKSTIGRRIARRMQVQRALTMADYLAILRDDSRAAQALFADLLISVTTFFRDTIAFEKLAALVIPRLFDDKGASDTIRIWAPGCATGEEAYSIAILLLEEASRHEIRCGLQIFASDLDDSALAIAREGRYPVAVEADMTEERLRRFFTREGDHYRVARELREIVLIAKHSLLKIHPFRASTLSPAATSSFMSTERCNSRFARLFTLRCAAPDTFFLARPKTLTVLSERSAAPWTANRESISERPFRQRCASHRGQAL
jgi:two-component system CheB/CheR fusion protein